MNEQSVIVLNQRYHRNGVGGDGFIVSLLKWMNPVEAYECEDDLFVAVTYPKEGHRTGLMTEREFAAATVLLNVDLMRPESEQDSGWLDLYGQGWRGADQVGPIVAKAWHDMKCEGGEWSSPCDPFGCGHARKEDDQ